MTILIARTALIAVALGAVAFAIWLAAQLLQVPPAHWLVWQAPFVTLSALRFVCGIASARAAMTLNSRPVLLIGLLIAVNVAFLAVLLHNFNLSI